MPDDNVEIGLGVDPSKAKSGFEDLFAQLEKMGKELDELTEKENAAKDAQEELASGSEHLEGMADAVSQIASRFGDLGEAISTSADALSALAAGNYLNVTLQLIDAVNKDWEEHNKLVSDANDAYVKLRSQSDETFKSQQQLLDKAVEAAKAVGGSAESATEEKMAKIRMGTLGAEGKDWSDWQIGLISSIHGGLREAGGVSAGPTARESLDTAAEALLEQQRIQKKIEERKQAQKNAEEEEKFITEMQAWSEKGRDLAIERERKRVEAEEKFINDMQAWSEKGKEKMIEGQKKRVEAEEKWMNDMQAWTEAPAIKARERANKELAKLDKEDEEERKKDEKSDRRRKEMEAITDQKKDQFAGGIDTAYDAMYNRMMKAGSATGKSNEEIAKEQDALRERWRQEDKTERKDEREKDRQLWREIRDKPVGGMK